MKSFDGYLKKKLGNDYVLLAGGGEKSINDWLHYERHGSSSTTASVLLDANNATDGWHDVWGYIDNCASTVNHGTLILNTYCSTPFQLFMADTNILYLYKRWKSGGVWSDWKKISAGYADTAGSAATISDTYYWANIAISKTLNLATSPTFGSASIINTHADLILLANTLNNYAVIRFGHADNYNAVDMFLNGTERTADGGVGNFTIRNNGGKILLKSTTGVDVDNFITMTGSLPTILLGGSRGGGSGEYLTRDNNNYVYLASNRTGRVYLESTSQPAPYFRNSTGDYVIYHSGNLPGYQVTINGTDYSLVANGMVDIGSYYPFYKVGSSSTSSSNVANANTDFLDGISYVWGYVSNCGTTANHGLLIQDTYCSTKFQIWNPDNNFYWYKRANSTLANGTWLKMYAGYADSIPSHTLWGNTFNGTLNLTNYLTVTPAVSDAYNILNSSGTITSKLGYTSAGYSYWSAELNGYEIRIYDDGKLYFSKFKGSGTFNYDILHSGNYTNYVYSKSDSDTRYVNATGDSMSGNLTFNYVSGTTQASMVRFLNSSGALAGYLAYNENSYGNYIELYDPVIQRGIYIGSSGQMNAALPYYNAGGLKRMWHEGNDGSGSGLDADLLDGYHLTDIYWANVKVSGTSSTTTEPTFKRCFLTGPLYIGANGTNYNQGWDEGIRLYGSTTSGSWSKIDFGCEIGKYNTSHAYQWSIGRNTANKFFFGHGTDSSVPVMLFDTNNYVGIGTATPSLKLDVDGHMHLGGSLYITNVATGSYNEGIRIANTTSGSYSTICVGTDPSAVTGYTAYQWLFGRDSSNLWFMNHGGSVIWNISTSNHWTISGNVTAPNFYTTSDRNKKQNISLFSEHIRKFQLKDTEKWHYGVIAQEVPKLFVDGEEGNMTVNYNSMLSYYIGLLENRVAQLESELKALKEKLGSS